MRRRLTIWRRVAGRWRHKVLGLRLSAMAGPTGGGGGHVRHLADVISVDLRDHLYHQARALLFVFGIGGEIALGQIVIHLMAKVASHSQLRGEALHHLHEFGLLDVRRKDF